MYLLARLEALHDCLIYGKPTRRDRLNCPILARRQKHTLMVDSGLYSPHKAKQYYLAAWKDVYLFGTGRRVPLFTGWHTRKVSYSSPASDIIKRHCFFPGDIIQAVAVSIYTRRVNARLMTVILHQSFDGALNREGCLLTGTSRGHLAWWSQPLSSPNGECSRLQS